ncbi:hypothetical protein [Ligilactobacillus sp. LYQ60]|uniref:hypothetical protein n=1 Tax=unclassified Ligilactobacillus TaxID=2767920 RepID=UPI003852FF16
MALSKGKDEIIIDTILKPMFLIKLPGKDKREFFKIKKSIETVLKECKKVEFPQKKKPSNHWNISLKTLII